MHQLGDVVRRPIRRVDQQHVHALQDVTAGHAAEPVAEQRRDRRDHRAKRLGHPSKAVTQAVKGGRVQRTSIGRSHSTGRGVVAP